MFIKQKTKIVAGLIAAFLGLCARPLFAKDVSDQIREGNAFYKKEDFLKASEKFTQALDEDSESDIINFNLGNVSYKLTKYEEALKHFHKTLLSEDLDLQEKAYYNLGNTQYKVGLGFEQNNIDKAIEMLEKALDYYQSAMKLNKGNQDAKYNYDFVKKELDRLKREKEEQPQDQDQDQEQEQDKQDKEDKKDKQDQDQEQEQEQQGEDQKAEGSGAQEDQQQEKGKQDQKSSKDQEQSQASDEGNKENAESKEAEADGKDSQSREDDLEPEQNNSQEGGENQSEDAAYPHQNGQAQGSEATGGQFNSQEMTEREVEMLLEAYQQGEEPKGLLNPLSNKMNREPVYQDW